MARIDDKAIVVDAGPLIHLDELKCIDLLGDFSSLLTPETVWREAHRHRPQLQLEQIPVLRVVSAGIAPTARLAVLVETLNLDAGETAALALVEQSGLHVFLTDDSAARVAAESLGYRVHGTIGIFVRSIRRGLRSQSEVLDILAGIRDRSTLHISQSLLTEVISQVATP